MDPGTATGKPAALDELKTAKAAAGTAPVLAGSGVGPANLGAVLAYADGLIVGTAFKQDRITTNPVDPARVREFMSAVEQARTEP